MPPKTTDDIQAIFQNFVQNTSSLLNQVGDTIRDQANKSKDLVEEKLKERELNHEFQAFGKEVFGLVAAGKLELADELSDRLERIQALVKEIDGLKAHEETEKGDDDAPKSDDDDAPKGDS